MVIYREVIDLIMIRLKLRNIAVGRGRCSFLASSLCRVHSVGRRVRGRQLSRRAAAGARAAAGRPHKNHARTWAPPGLPTYLLAQCHQCPTTTNAHKAFIKFIIRLKMYYEHMVPYPSPMFFCTVHNEVCRGDNEYIN